MNSTTVSGFTFHTFFIKDDSRVPLNTTAPRALEAAIINYRLSQIQKDIIIIQDACYLCKSLKITISITFLHTIHWIQTAIITFTTICHYIPPCSTIYHHIPPYTTVYHNLPHLPHLPYLPEHLNSTTMSDLNSSTMSDLYSLQWSRSSSSCEDKNLAAYTILFVITSKTHYSH